MVENNRFNKFHYTGILHLFHRFNFLPAMVPTGNEPNHLTNSIQFITTDFSPSQTYHFPLTAVSCHLVIKFMLAAIFRRIFQCLTDKKRISLNWSLNFSKLAPIGFAGGLDVAFSNWGLELITVSL